MQAASVNLWLQYNHLNPRDALSKNVSPRKLTQTVSVMNNKSKASVPHHSVTLISLPYQILIVSVAMFKVNLSVQTVNAQRVSGKTRKHANVRSQLIAKTAHKPWLVKSAQLSVQMVRLKKTRNFAQKIFVIPCPSVKTHSRLVTLKKIAPASAAKLSVERISSLTLRLVNVASVASVTRSANVPRSKTRILVSASNVLQTTATWDANKAILWTKNFVSVNAIKSVRKASTYFPILASAEKHQGRSLVKKVREAADLGTIESAITFYFQNKFK